MNSPTMAPNLLTRYIVMVGTLVVRVWWYLLSVVGFEGIGFYISVDQVHYIVYQSVTSEYVVNNPKISL